MCATVLVLLVLLGQGSARASRFDGGLPGGLLDFGSSARALSLGRALAPAAAGPEAVLWNPGGLGMPFSNGAAFTHVSLFQGASFDEISYAHAFDRPFGLGASILSLDNGGLVRRDANNDETGSFSDTRRAFLVGWGVQPARAFSFGATHKILTRSLDGQSATAVDSDLGAAARWRRYQGTLRLMNLMGAGFSRDGGSDALPRRVGIGAAMSVLEPLLAVGEVVTGGGVTDLRFGLEYTLLQRIAFRAGWDGVSPSFGAGWRYKAFGMDYGVARHDAMGLSHRFTVSAGWGAAKSKDLARQEWRDKVYGRINETLAEYKKERAARKQEARAFVRHLEDAEQALEQGDFRQADASASLALALDPEDSRAQEVADRAALELARRQALAQGGPLIAGTSEQSAADEELRRPLAFRTRRPKALAVVIGIERYRDVVPAAFAARDAELMRRQLEDAFGILPENIVFLRDERAGLADLKGYLEGWLRQKASSGTEVFVYYSGHGTADPSTGSGYLVPFDASPATIRETGYPLHQMYALLASLPFKRGLILLDACFSGSGGPRTVIAQGTRPIVPVIEDPVLASGKIAVLSAAKGAQIAGIHERGRQGLLTYHMVRGLRGEADADKDGQVSLAELYTYVLPLVIVDARSAHREQEPSLLPSIEVADPWGSEPLVQLPR